jgi:threonine/homoserine/homoserine lactone efflux protein
MDRLLEFVVSGWTPFNSPLVAFILTSFIIEMTPGPNMAYLAVLGASRGRLAGFSAVLGVALVALLGIAVGLGGGSLVLNNRVVYESLRWAGALYLCWLAFDGWRAARKPIEAVPVSPSHFIHFRRGFVTNLLTPKAAVFFIAELPEFTQGPPPARELALLVSVYVGIATLVHGLVVVPAGGLQMLFAAPQRRKMAGNIFAVLLLAIAVWLFVSGRR